MPLTESGPLHAVVQRSANTRLTTADRLSTSGLDYMTWASKMVDEGKMYWANSASNTTNVEVWVWRLTVWGFPRRGISRPHEIGAWLDNTSGDHVIHNHVYTLLIVASFWEASDQSWYLGRTAFTFQMPSFFPPVK